jgi:hypothetical protein
LNLDGHFERIVGQLLVTEDERYSLHQPTCLDSIAVSLSKLHSINHYILESMEEEKNQKTKGLGSSRGFSTAKNHVASLFINSLIDDARDVDFHIRS